MPNPEPRGPARPCANERGVALPVALAALVVMSLAVTGILVTSSTEAAISIAQKDATASLYAVEGALEEYVARKAEASLAGTDSLAPVLDDPLVSGFVISAARLYGTLDTLTADTLYQQQTYSLVSVPATRRGRSVGTLLDTERKAKLFRISVEAGLTIGGDVEVTGTSAISDGRNAACDSAAATNALQVTSGSTITQSGTSEIEGVADTASYSKDQMVDLLLGGLSLQDAAKLATIKFGPGELSGRSKSYDSSGPRPKSDVYNWGCPTADSCTGVTGNEVNMAYYPTVAIDAGGGTVTLDGNHGQGVLIVHNGSLEIKGNFVYEGIVLVEQDLLVQGTGSGGVKLEGAVVALGQNSAVDDNASGNAVITYNECSIVRAQEGANSQRIAAAAQIFSAPTYGWFEVVR